MDRSWLILAIPGWAFGVVAAILIATLGFRQFISTPVSLQCLGIFAAWGVAVPVTVWRMSR